MFLKRKQNISGNEVKQQGCQADVSAVTIDCIINFPRLWRAPVSRFLSLQGELSLPLNPWVAVTFSRLVSSVLASALKW